MTQARPCQGGPDRTPLYARAESDPLPSFEKRQALAQQLGMTPRSVQIWFQNRRQRLLKPLRQGELSPRSEHCESLGDSISESGSSSDPPGQARADAGLPVGRLPMHPAAGPGAAHHHHSYPMMAQLASLLGPLLQAEGISSSAAMPAAIAHLSSALAAEGSLAGHSGWTALSDNVGGAGAAVLLAHALQQQLTAGMAAQLTAGMVEQCQPAGAAPTTAHPHTVAHGARHAATPPPTTEGVDGLLLLSACADARPPAPPPSAASSGPMGGQSVQAVRIMA